MSRWRHYVLPALLLMPVFYVGVKLLLTPVLIRVPVRYAPVLSLVMYSNVSDCQDWQRGWPWVYQHEIDISGVQPLDPEFSANEFSWPLLFADVLALTLVGAGAIWIGLRHRRRRGAWLRFSLREVLILITALGIGLGWWARADGQWNREQRLWRLYGFLDVRTDYVGPEWLRRLVPEMVLTIFDRVTSINPDSESHPDLISVDPEEYETHWHISPDTIEMAKISLLELPFARRLSIYDGNGQRVVYDKPVWGNFESEGLKDKATNGLAQIDDVYFGLTEIGDQAEYLIDQLTSVKSMEFEYCKFQGNIFGAIARLRTVEDLRFFDCSNFDDVAMAKLVSLHELRRLTLDGTQLSDASIENVLRFPHLEQLWLEGHAWTDAGIRRLSESPSLKHLVLYDSAVSDETVHLLRRKMHVVVKAAEEILGFETTQPGQSSDAKFEKLLELQQSIIETAKDASPNPNKK